MIRKVVLMTLVVFSSIAPCFGEEKRANRLVKEKSPYLLLHAHNPVDWYPWGEEAFAKAKKENKLILLSVGYSTCHWCHVMERESFENEEIAKFLNENYVSIKLDREERPDVDQVYMTALQALTRQNGGWPLNMFLTPDLKPFFGGTYFPPKDQQGRMGFKTVLSEVQKVWKTKPEEILNQAKLGHGQMEEYFTGALKLSAAKEDLNQVLVDESVAQALDQIDPAWGGLGKEMKFPQVNTFRLMLQSVDKETRQAAIMTCQKMMNGGIHDQVGGGFHRYAVDREWLVPHFEKMLYDQAQLLDLYLDAWLVSGEKDFQEVARGIADYVLRDLTHPEGGFYCAEDAQSEGKEGKYFCWTLEELKKVLSGDEVKLARDVLGVTEQGNFVDHSDPEALPNQNVLHYKKVRASLSGEETVAVKGILEKLAKVRAKRVPPPTDDKVLASWNGLMIGSMARAGRVLGEQKYLQAAEKAHRFVKAKLWDAEKERLSHRWRDGEKDETLQAESYLFFLRGTRQLYEATLDAGVLAFAVKLAEESKKHFYDEENGGFFQGEKRDDLVLRLKGQHDSAIPTESSVAVREFLILAEITGRKDFSEVAEKTLRAYVPLIREAPGGMGEMIRGMRMYLKKPARLVIVGQEGQQEMLNLAAKHPDPNMILLSSNGPVSDFTKTLKPRGDKATAYYCEGETCQLPVNTPEKLQALLLKQSAK
ncbi:thioredoxin domain-containing protein [bacterium]|nr:thioredoxin domain-containing protein [bacterium]